MKTALQTSLTGVHNLVSLKNTAFDPGNLKCCYDQKITSFFSSDSESVIA